MAFVGDGITCLHRLSCNVRRCRRVYIKPYRHKHYKKYAQPYVIMPRVSENPFRYRTGNADYSGKRRAGKRRNQNSFKYLTNQFRPSLSSKIAFSSRISLSENCSSSKSAATKFSAEPSNRFLIRLFTCDFLYSFAVRIGV